MNRRRGRRSTRRDMEELQAEIRQARLEWEARPLEERIRRGRGGGHSTPRSPLASSLRSRPSTSALGSASETFEVV
jgi:hypothetical protein